MTRGASGGSPRGAMIATAIAAAALLAPPAAIRAQTPLALREAVEAATVTSRSLERARLGIDVARADLALARASFGPSVSADAGAAWIANPPDGITIPAGDLGTLTDPLSTFPTLVPDRPIVLVPDPDNLGFQASFQLTQPLYTWGKLRAARDAAVSGLSASVARYGETERELRRTVTLAYAGVIAGRESVPVVEDLAALLDDRLADARRRYEAGDVTRSAVLTAESRLATARLQLVRSRQGLRSAEESLRWLTGLDFGALDPIGPVVRLAEETELIRRAVARDPRLDELRATSEQASVQLRVAEASRPLLPDVGLDLRAEVRGQRIPLLEANWVDSWNANLTISIGASARILDSGRNAAEQVRAGAQYRQALSAVTEYRESIPLQVRAALERYLIAKAMLAESEAKAAAAEEQRRVAQVAFDNEILSRAELLGARIGVLEAQLTAVAARLELDRGRADLEYFVGPL